MKRILSVAMTGSMTSLRQQRQLLFVLLLGTIVSACTGMTSSPTSSSPVPQPAPAPASTPAQRSLNVWVEVATESGFNRPLGAVPTWAIYYGSNRQAAIDNAQTTCFAGTGSRRNLCDISLECGPPSAFEDSAHPYYAYVSSPLDNLGFASALTCGYATESAAIQAALNLCNGVRRCTPQWSGSVLKQ